MFAKRYLMMLNKSQDEHNTKKHMFEKVLERV